MIAGFLAGLRGLSRSALELRRDGLELRRDPLGFLERVARERGDPGPFWIGGRRAFLFARPEHVAEVLQTDVRTYVKRGPGWDAMRVFLGDGMLTADGEDWLERRRIAQPAFDTQRLRALCGVITRATTEVVDRWNMDATIDVGAAMADIALRVAGETLLGCDLGARRSIVERALRDAGSYTAYRMRVLVPPPLWAPTPRHRTLRRAMADLDAIVDETLESRRAAPGPNDLLSMWLASTGSRMDRAALRAEIRTMFVAGHETTSNLLTWALALLSLHPIEARIARDEARSVLGDRAPDRRAPNWDDVPKLPRIAAVLREALRLYPPAWWTGRECVEDRVVGGVTIPRGALVFVSPWVTHRLPSLWTNPEGFDPERFIGDGTSPRSRFSFFPFGGGPRQCIGDRFAMLEAQIVLAMILQRYELELVDRRALRPIPTVTLKPHGPVSMRVRALA